MSRRKQKINVRISTPNNVDKQERYQEILTEFYTKAIIALLEKNVPDNKKEQAKVLTQVCKFLEYR